MDKSTEGLELLYRDEFYHNNRKDAFGRYNYLYSGEQQVFQPTVSNHLFENGFKPKYPGNKDFAICLTHDIDTLTSRPSPTLIMNQLRRGQFSDIGREMMKGVSKWNNPNNNIHKIIEHEARYNAHSTYFFLSLKNGEKDFNYSPDEIKHIFKQVKQSGSEIALHGGHETAKSEKKIIAEKKMLEDAAQLEVKGFRSHYLKFEYPETWRYLQNIGFDYDSTFCFPDVIGFRNGMCYPFKPIGNTQAITEIPLIIADHVLFNYMRTPLGVASEFVEELMNAVKKVNGVLVILWHNYYYVNDLVDFYDKILKTGTDKNAWFPTLQELNNWWKQENYFEQYQKISPGIFSDKNK